MAPPSARGHRFFIVDGTQVSQRRVSTSGIVEPLNVIEHIRFGLVPGLVVSPVGAFDLECREKAFHSGVVPAVTTTTHVVPRLLYADATPEALAYALATGWPSGGILSAEAGAVFGVHGIGQNTILRNLALLNVR